jgi:hypothetical protein
VTAPVALARTVIVPANWYSIPRLPAHQVHAGARNGSAITPAIGGRQHGVDSATAGNGAQPTAHATNTIDPA